MEKENKVQREKQKRFIKVFADSIDKRYGAVFFSGVFVFFVGLYITAIFAVPEVFQQLYPDTNCVYNGNQTSSDSSTPIFSYCSNFNLNNTKVWQMELANLNITNVFLNLNGIISRNNVAFDLEDGNLIRSLH